jgi:hypothetical protein
MALQRADRLKEPPIVGRWYLAPAIWWPWGGERTTQHLYWPVMGAKHADADFFNFPREHYHVDRRFLTAKHILLAGRRFYDRSEVLNKIAQTPLNHIADPKFIRYRPELRRMRCSAAEIDWPFPDRIHALVEAYSGRQCRRGSLGFVCPHRNFPLGSIAPVDGVITCPLHGLRINAATGQCLPPEAHP